MATMKKAKDKIAKVAKKAKNAMKAWTETGDGTDYQTETDGYHSGDFEAVQAKLDHASKSEPMEGEDGEMASGDTLVIRHLDNSEKICGHDWRRGMLPGNSPIKTCLTCLKSEPITMEEWVTLR